MSSKKYSVENAFAEGKFLIEDSDHCDFTQDEHYVELKDLGGTNSFNENYLKSEVRKNEQGPFDTQKGQEKQGADFSVKTRRYLKNDRIFDQCPYHNSGKWKKAVILVTLSSVIVIASVLTFTLQFGQKSKTATAAVLSNLCESNPCLNTGTCFNNETSFSCSCPDGYYGDVCEETPCSVSPCLNDGQCYIQNHTYTCQCPKGYGGSGCQETPCAGSPCLNGGQCSIQNHTFSCQCTKGYGGNACQVKAVSYFLILKTPCSGSPGLNGGEC